MCDSLVALPNSTKNQTTIFGKSADCEVNEANALVKYPRKKYTNGELVRTTHLMIPQSNETNEIVLIKACWAYGCEIGVNEFGLVMGEEAVYTKEADKEKKDGLIGPDLMRIALERTKNCKEAIELITSLLEFYGQGGNCELSGNSHFDSSILMADLNEGFVLETAGRNWAVKKVANVESISNLLTLRSDWDLISSQNKNKDDWAEKFNDSTIIPKLGSIQRRNTTIKFLNQTRGTITVKKFFEIMRHHGENYHPAVPEVQENICMHAGPQENRKWQADGVMVTEIDKEAITIWVTGTSGNCVSIFKPVFFGVDLPDIGPEPSYYFNRESLWWKHELLHRRAMMDFSFIVPEIRNDFDRIEEEFISYVEKAKRSTINEKKELMDYCFLTALQATEKWILKLSKKQISKSKYPEYNSMWNKMNNECGISQFL